MMNTRSGLENMAMLIATRAGSKVLESNGSVNFKGEYIVSQSCVYNDD